MNKKHPPANKDNQIMRVEGTLTIVEKLARLEVTIQSNAELNNCICHTQQSIDRQ